MKYIIVGEVNGLKYYLQMYKTAKGEFDFRMNGLLDNAHIFHSISSAMDARSVVRNRMGASLSVEDFEKHKRPSVKTPIAKAGNKK
jgi:hypothetical protein